MCVRRHKRSRRTIRLRTGALDLRGAINRVGGADRKARSARDAGATLFLLPSGNIGDVSHLNLDPLRVKPTAHLLQALAEIFPTVVRAPTPQAIKAFENAVSRIFVALPTWNSSASRTEWEAVHIEAAVVAGEGYGRVLDVQRVGWRGKTQSYVDAVDAAIGWIRSNPNRIVEELGSPQNYLCHHDFMVGALDNWMHKNCTGAALAVLLNAFYDRRIEKRVILMTGELRLQDGGFYPQYGNDATQIPAPNHLVATASNFDYVLVDVQEQALTGLLRGHGVNVRTFQDGAIGMVKALWRSSGASQVP